ncbi:MAG TPA: DNA-directed RNA polymerase subunit B'' [Candidatus Nanoarchaeia archaeon]|nr:DNA-directed RNA polymerase subunit B'' [Candidatus Nanoarchaeia archaeon]
MNKKLIIKKYFEENSFVESNIRSFNNFIEKDIHKIIQEIGDIIPTIIPQDMQDFRIKLDKISITKPQLVEADGSRRDIYPMEARLRKISYAAPINLEISAHIDGVQRESFTTQIGLLPIMLKSKYCHLHGMKEEELIKHGEDPHDNGGYFILNGNERVLMTVEDLAANMMFVEENKIGTSRYTAKVFSERGSYRVPHVIEQTKDGLIYLSFTRFKKIPIVAVIKALGLTKDSDIVQAISQEREFDDIFINLFNGADLKSEADAVDFISKKIGMSPMQEQRLEKTQDNLDKYLLPHLGIEPKDRKYKAINLCKLLRRFLIISKEDIKNQDKDHYMNKRLKLSGDLLSDLFRVQLRALVNDILYNFQRLVKRGKFHSIKIIIREKLLTSRINSAMATGVWVGGRKGLSQNMDRTNFLASTSHLQRVVSLLSATQENFAARALHATHWGRLCAIETPEGTSIGLRKNLALLSEITQEEIPEQKLKKSFEELGMEAI